MPQDLTTIKVWKCFDNIHCIEFVGKEGYTEVGAFKEDEMQEILIEDGERLIGIQSQQFSNN